jgi:exodeoxyribonuclease VII large subunit
MEQILLELEPARRVFTVRELNAAIRERLEAEFQDIWVAGEISGVRVAASGHYYFTLKEQDSVVRCVCFRQTARYLKFKPQDGVAVLARGRIDLYEARGEYQLLVEHLEPQGRGALQWAFDQLKKKLAAEGLFEAARKRPLPRLPRRIGIVTSPTGAVIRDMLQILERRFPGLHIRLYPALVQGAGSIEEVCAGVDYFSQSGWAEVVIVARGGGSLEDLWTFNEEAVARAIAACAVPVISAIGHETDVTIADFVADLRAPTPSAAAEMVIPTRASLAEQITAAGDRLERALRYRLARAIRQFHERGLDRAASLVARRVGRAFQRVDELEVRLAGLDPRRRLAATRGRLERAAEGLAARVRLRLAVARARLESLAAQTAQLSPLAVLERGYSIVQNEAGRILKDAADAPVDSAVGIRLARGRLKARVTEGV